MSNSKKSKKNTKQKLNLLPFIAIAVVVLAVAIVVFIPKEKPNNTGVNGANTENKTIEETNPTSGDTTPNNEASIAATLNDNGDVLIKEADITENATFLEYNSKDGITVGLLAVRASDGTVRTALNSCQVCNGSPLAYFIQKGDVVECQNCGNIFGLDMIEQERGGCNPIPIMIGEKTVTDTEIIIPAVFLEENAVKFENWKKF